MRLKNSLVAGHQFRASLPEALLWQFGGSVVTCQMAPRCGICTQNPMYIYIYIPSTSKGISLGDFLKAIDFFF